MRVYKVWGLGFSVSDFGFGVLGFGFRLQGLGMRTMGFSALALQLRAFGGLGGGILAWENGSVAEGLLLGCRFCPTIPESYPASFLGQEPALQKSTCR